MSRISKAFEDLKMEGGIGFIPFITAGDPDLDTTLEIMKALAALGATVIELGVPFSDPMADGPVIQASSQRALENHGVTVGDALATVTAFRRHSEVPVVLFGYLNPFYNHGIERLADESAKAGVDGFLITDVIDEEFRTYSDVFAARGLDLITLIAPTTTDLRLESILSGARGFVYAISTTGVTGNKKEIGLEARQLVERARNLSDVPIAVGFGIANSRDVEGVLEYADAAVVGSAIVRRIARAGSKGEAVTEVTQFVSGLLKMNGK